MSNTKNNASTENPSKYKIVLGSIILVGGFMSPLLIPFIIGSDLSTTTINTLSGLLAFGVPELCMLIAITIMGKPGYTYIKNKVGNYLKQFLPPDKVSKKRYYSGLVLFSIPIVLGVLYPYLIHFIPVLKGMPLWSHIAMDMMFFISIFVLGGEFWDKLSALFQYNTKITRVT